MNIAYIEIAYIERCVRGFQPCPNAYTAYRSRHLIVWYAGASTSVQHSVYSGEIIAAHVNDLIVKCGEETELHLLEVLPDGKRCMGVRD